ncbi:hypothetical protein ACOMHN_004293 [Nucella lapillus]
MPQHSSKQMPQHSSKQMPQHSSKQMPQHSSKQMPQHSIRRVCPFVRRCADVASVADVSKALQLRTPCKSVHYTDFDLTIITRIPPCSLCKQCTETSIHCDIPKTKMSAALKFQ